MGQLQASQGLPGASTTTGCMSEILDVSIERARCIAARCLCRCDILVATPALNSPATLANLSMLPELLGFAQMMGIYWTPVCPLWRLKNRRCDGAKRWCLELRARQACLAWDLTGDAGCKRSTRWADPKLLKILSICLPTMPCSFVTPKSGSLTFFCCARQDT
jgi:hypothetical protein